MQSARPGQQLDIDHGALADRCLGHHRAAYAFVDGALRHHRCHLRRTRDLDVDGRAVATLAVAAPFIRPFAAIFGFSALPWPMLGAMLAIVAGYVVATEMAKLWFYRSRSASH
jgi:hypothetical protein